MGVQIRHVRNMTPHSINIFSPDGEEVLVIPPGADDDVSRSRVRYRTRVKGKVNLMGIDVPVVHKWTENLPSLPEPVHGVVLVVSSMLLNLFPDRDDLYAPDVGPSSAVRGKNRVLMGVRRMQVPYSE